MFEIFFLLAICICHRKSSKTVNLIWAQNWMSVLDPQHVIELSSPAIKCYKKKIPSIQNIEPILYDKNKQCEPCLNFLKTQHEHKI